MLRLLAAALAAGAIFVGTTIADNPHAQAKNTSGLHAMFVKADMVKNTITFQTRDRSGQSKEMTLPVAKDAKILGENNKPETFATFTKNLRNEKDKSILVTKDNAGRQIVGLRDLPSGVTRH
jgi:hypothetical protein